MPSGKLCLSSVTTSNDQPDKLSQWLRAELERHGYDLHGPRAGGMTAFARDVGITLGSVSRILKGEKRTPELDTLRKIGKIFGYSLGEMLIFAGMAAEDELPVRPAERQEAERPSPRPRYEDAAEQRIWEIPEIPETMREQLVVMLRAMRAAATLPTSPRASHEKRSLPAAEVRELRQRS